MKYIIDLTQSQAAEIEYLIKKGKYRGFSQFIATAVENQFHIEKTEPGLIDCSLKKSYPSDKSHDEIENLAKQLNMSHFASINVSQNTVPTPSFSQLGCSLQKIQENKCWLWGQVNKIFPIKLGLRVLLVSINSAQWIDLESYRDKAADIACSLGTIIRENEVKKKKKRDDKISAGLPMIEKELKSKMRYRAHFLAYTRKDGRFEGALPFLRFVNLTTDDKTNTLVGLTEAGLEFARLRNPVIDENIFERSLSDIEVDFYLKHISKSVVGETNAIKWMINKIASGVVDREEINNAIKANFTKIWKASDAVINTQRSGLMSRMFELGLIDKSKNGVKVAYKLTSPGEKLL